MTSGAVAAGAALILAPQATGVFASAGMLAPDGRCKTLDAAGDGYVRTEAVWAIPLWSLARPASSSAIATAASAAVRGAPALLVSSAVNQDGRSSSLTAPNGPSQQEVISTAARSAFPSLSRPADALELHGTGTALGDPIEFGAAVAVISAAHDAFAQLSRAGYGGEGGGASMRSIRERPTLALSSIKSSFGHSEAAAGAFGMVHAMMQLQRRGGGQMAHLRVLNPFVAQVVDRRGESTPAAAARRQDRAAVTQHTGGGGGGGGGGGTVGGEVSMCSVSSFAFQGTNAHGIMGTGVGSVSKSVAALRGRPAGLLDRKRLWCAVRPPPLISQCLGVRRMGYTGEVCGDTAVMIADMSLPQRVSAVEQHSCFGRRVVPAGLVMNVAAAGVRVALAHSTSLEARIPEEAASVHCVDVVFPTGVSCPHGAGKGGRLRIEVNVRGGVSISDEHGTLHRRRCVLTCAAVSVRLGVRDAAFQSQSLVSMKEAASTIIGDTQTTSGAEVPSHCALMRRGCSATMSQLYGGAAEIPLSLFFGAAEGDTARDSGREPAAKTIAAVRAAWFADAPDDVGDAHAGDVIGVRRGPRSDDVDVVASARCRAWALTDAHARTVTRGDVDREASLLASTTPSPIADASQRDRSTAGNRPRLSPLDMNDRVIPTLFRWISSVIFSTSSRRGADAEGQSDDVHESDDDEARWRLMERRRENTALLEKVLSILNAAPRPDGLDPIDRDTNFLDMGFDSLQVMELRRQLESAGPSGCVLTATAVMDHPTPARLVDHMMTWHDASDRGDVTAREGRGRRESSSASRTSVNTDGVVGRGRHSTRATLVLLGFSVLILLFTCIMLAVALQIQRQSATGGQIVDASRRDGDATCRDD